MRDPVEMSMPQSMQLSTLAFCTFCFHLFWMNVFLQPCRAQLYNQESYGVINFRGKYCTWFFWNCSGWAWQTWHDCFKSKIVRIKKGRAATFDPCAHVKLLMLHAVAPTKPQALKPRLTCTPVLWFCPRTWWIMMHMPSMVGVEIPSVEIPSVMGRIALAFETLLPFSGKPSQSSSRTEALGCSFVYAFLLFVTSPQLIHLARAGPWGLV